MVSSLESAQTLHDISSEFTREKESHEFRLLIAEEIA
jgi:hypothetical protein